MNCRPALVAALCCAAGLSAQNTGISLSNLADGYLDVAYAPQLVPQSGITVEAWITYDETTIPTGWRFPTLLRQGHSVGGSEDYFLRIEAGNSNSRTLRWKVVTANGGAVTVNWSFAAGRLLQWTHVAATYNGAQAVLYVDGVQVANAVGNGQPIRDLNAESLRIGKGSDVGTPMEVWNGQIDEVRLWPFARTAAEILQTKDLQLDSIPGRVSTWNLDNHLLDTSSGLHATATGSVPFVANSLNLTGFPAPLSFTFGASTPGCLGSILTTIGSAPRPGNADFAAVATRVPAGAVGFGAIAFGVAPAPLSVAGIDYWLDPASSLLLLGTASTTGVLRQGLPLPAWLPTGQSFGFQFGVFDPCGPQGVTSSDAIVVVVQ